MNLKKAFPALFLLLLLGVTLSEDAKPAKPDAAPTKETDTGGDGAPTAPPKPKGPACFQKALQALGLEGVPNAVEESLEMCPGVKHSCCKPSDQAIIYENWVTKGGEKFLQNRFQFYQEVFLYYYNSEYDYISPV